MPEGDTIVRVAQALRPYLLGQKLFEVKLREIAGADFFINHQVKAIRTLGKHMLIDVDSGYSLRVHLGMYGEWHRYRLRERWKRPAWDARIILQTKDLQFVCFHASQVEVFRTEDSIRHPVLSRLGPDLIAPNIYEDKILFRSRESHRQNDHIGELLLDQEVACGIGNIYKNEILFLEGVHPWRKVKELSDLQIHALYQRGSELLKANCGPQERITTLGPEGAHARIRGARLWVYGREGQRCFRCSNLIQIDKQGDHARVTFWCEVCQCLRSD